MKNTRTFVLAASASAVVVFGGLLFGMNALAKGPAGNVLVAASPSPAWHSNESATHEQGESAAQEAAENNGTFHPGPGNGPSNENPTHETSEPAAREASEKS